MHLKVVYGQQRKFMDIDSLTDYIILKYFVAELSKNASINYENQEHKENSKENANACFVICSRFSTDRKWAPSNRILRRSTRVRTYDTIMNKKSLSLCSYLRKLLYIRVPRTRLVYIFSCQLSEAAVFVEKWRSQLMEAVSVRAPVFTVGAVRQAEPARRHATNANTWGR